MPDLPPDVNIRAVLQKAADEQAFLMLLIPTLRGLTVASLEDRPLEVERLRV